MYDILEEEAEKCLFRLTNFTELLFERFLTGTREPASFVKIPKTEKSVKNQLTTPCFWQFFFSYPSVSYQVFSSSSEVSESFRRRLNYFCGKKNTTFNKHFSGLPQAEKNFSKNSYYS